MAESAALSLHAWNQDPACHSLARQPCSWHYQACETLTCLGDRLAPTALQLWLRSRFPDYCLWLTASLQLPGGHLWLIEYASLSINDTC